MKWGELILLNPETHPHIPHRIELVQESVVIGRTHKKQKSVLDVALSCGERSKGRKSISISRKHVTFVRESANTYSIRDLKSKNGTLVNNIRISLSPLKDQDIVHLGGGTNLNVGESVLNQIRVCRKNPENANGFAVQHEDDLKLLCVVFKFVVCEGKDTGKKRKREPSDVDAERDSKKQKLEREHKEKKEKMKKEKIANFEKKKEELLADKSKTLQSLKQGTPLSDDVRRELKCHLCKQLVIDSLLLQCSHFFCKRCLVNEVHTTREKVCPKCHVPILKPPIRNLTTDSLIEKLVPFMTDEEQLERRNQKEKIKEEEAESLVKIDKYIRAAKKQGKTYFQLTQNWGPLRRVQFRDSMKYHKGKQPRKKFLNLVGLNDNFVRTAGRANLKKACQNLELSLPELDCASCRRRGSFNEGRARSTIRDFVNNDFVHYFQ